jgi:hypothetical protein
MKGHYVDCFYLTKYLNHLSRGTSYGKCIEKNSSSINNDISLLSLVSVFLYIGNNDINNRYAIAQLTTENFFPNNTENIENLDKLLGDHTAIILNNTNVSNPNNTLLDSITVNLQEDCMKLPNSNHVYCP